MIAQLKEILNEFSTKLEVVENEHIDIIDRATNSITLSRNAFYRLKGLLLQNNFNSPKEEIDFFKNIKQTVAIPLIYYSEVKSFELQFPMAHANTQRKYINKKIIKLNQFFSRNMDFMQYIERGHSHFDLQYFSRSYLDSYHIISSKFYFQDPDFTTARDMLLGKIRAYQKFILYLENRLPVKIQKSVTASGQSDSGSKNNLQWTSSKAALTELIYALYSNRVINNGDVDIKEIAVALQRVFQFDLRDFYKIYAEIKSRKNSRTKFLDTLSIGLSSFMDETEK